MIMRRFILAGAFAALVLAAAPGRAQPVVQLPGEGAGHDAVATACSQCHSLGAITQLRQGEQAWRYQVYDMILRGAQIAPSEIDGVVKYLATSFGPGVPFAVAPPAMTLPDGNGKELVEGGCALCHGLDRVVAAKRSKGEWNGIVARMVFFGAPVDVDQAKTVAAYLDSKFGAD
jgi:mono/diheme cytochrome c family protein